MIGPGGEKVGASKDWMLVAGVDLGIKRDNSAVVVLACGRMGTRYAGRIRLATAKMWKPPKDGKVDLMEIEKYILEVDAKLGLERVAYDPWQAEMLAQRLEIISKHGRRSGFNQHSSGPWLKEIPQTSSNLRDIASLVLESFADRRLQLYPYEPLRRDLIHLRVEERKQGGGFRLVSPRDASGHGDCASAFCYALYAGHEEISKRGPPIVGCISEPSLSSPDYYESKYQSMKDEEERIQNLYNRRDPDDEGVAHLINLIRSRSNY